MDALNPIADLPMGFGMALAQDLSAMDPLRKPFP